METASSKVMVVKIGSSTVTCPDGSVNRDYLAGLARQVACVRERGWAVVIVSSGAIACGLSRLGIEKRPCDLPSLQAAASVGQPLFSAAYDEAFAQEGIATSLVLLTRRDTADRTSYLHARDTLRRLIDFQVVPIVNENDTVSVEQIKFGDNDTLGALVACLLGADLCVILSDVEGFYDANPATHPDARLVSRIERIDAKVLAAAGDAGSSKGTGGMVTKLRAARALSVAGIPLVICSGAAADPIVAAARGDSMGTLFSAVHLPHEITPRKLWIALGDSSKGAVVVDDGAKRALIERGSSLLCVGVACVEGRFSHGDVVDIKDRSGYLFARGHVSFDSDEVELAIGRTREELAANRLLKALAVKELVHRDELVVFE
ncbi:glutamate 5-kinase [Gordonibacter sp. Marseille-P4307]|uniref:glutamate 5-kinase n=1 Tax=Gordonibacter sp. Marseille-P4307 TaxID=2161815 RepID=UPI000F549037|nr:glutamate 5-kinase [Gordonibacter sp. Marseille-P4307]